MKEHQQCCEHSSEVFTYFWFQPPGVRHPAAPSRSAAGDSSRGLSDDLRRCWSEPPTVTSGREGDQVLPEPNLPDCPVERFKLISSGLFFLRTGMLFSKCKVKSVDAICCL